jgi:hypothetical protein
MAVEKESKPPSIIIGLDRDKGKWRPFVVIHDPCSGEPHSNCCIVEKYVDNKSYDLENAKRKAVSIGKDIAKAYGTGMEFVTGKN